MKADVDQHQSLEICHEIIRAEQLMREYETNSMYLQAENQRQILQNLKKAIAIPSTNQQFYQTWSQALQSVQQTNRQRWKDFELIWASKLKEHDIKGQELLESIHQKHRNRIHDLAQVSERGIRYPKWSIKLLELRKRQYLLGRTQRYSEAEQIKIQADALESVERFSILESIDKDIKVKTVRLEKQHEKEVQICMDKMELEKRCILEGRAQMAETLRCQCDRALNQVKNRARHAAQRRQILMQGMNRGASGSAGARPHTSKI